MVFRDYGAGHSDAGPRRISPAAKCYGSRSDCDCAAGHDHVDRSCDYGCGCDCCYDCGCVCCGVCCSGYG